MSRLDAFRNAAAEFYREFLRAIYYLHQQQVVRNLRQFSPATSFGFSFLPLITFCKAAVKLAWPLACQKGHPKGNFYSDRRLFTGFAIAALSA